MKNIFSKKNLPLTIALTIQLFYFYIFPIFAGKNSAIGMVLSIICATFLISFLLATVWDSKLKFLYPIAISILFIPTVFIFYNASAAVHILWYFVISSLGILFGCTLRFALNKLT